LQNSSRNRGIGRYVKSLFDALAMRDDIELFGLLNSAMHESFEEARTHVAKMIGAERVVVFPGLEDTCEHISENKDRKKLGEAAYEAFVREFAPDVLLAGSVAEGFGDDTCLSLKSPAAYLKAAILYDLIPFVEPDKYLGDSKTKNWYADKIRQLESADVLLAISNSSRSEAIEFLNRPPKSAVAISTAVDRSIFFADGPSDPEVLRRLRITKPFVMHASAIEPRKNFDGLMRAFAALPADIRTKHQLVFVGSANAAAREELTLLARKLGLTDDDLILTGYVPDPDLVQIFRACRLFVFPSFHEGFGLPALEAMACGCPTIGSNITSVPEVVGSAAYTFDPADTAQMSALMGTLLSDQKAWKKARSHAIQHAAKFSWEKVADRTVAALKSAFAGRAAVPPAAFPSALRMASHIADRVDLPSIDPQDVAILSKRLAAGEDELVAKRAELFPKKGKTWRIEGPFDSSYSLALVNRETARAMARLGWRVALHSTEGPGDFPPDPAFLAANPDLEAMHARVAKDGGRRSFAVSRLLYPPRVADMSGLTKMLHHYAWEESGFPQAWVDDFNDSLTIMTALSTHVEKIMIDNGVSVPLATSGCGVDHWERIVAEPSYTIEARGFRFLHVSSCFPRKGVDAMLAAYEAAFSVDDDVTLVIKTFDNPHNDLREKLAELRDRNPRFPHVVTIFGDITDAELKALYRQCDVMVGPSFAEGFGVPFAEAMLTGIPVITTNWGGHLDFCNHGNSWLVDFKFERAKTHFGLWASAWARIDAGSLARAMRDAHAASPEMRAAMAARGRDQLLARHRWDHVARRLTAAVATLPQVPKREPRIGWISTWNSKCGIATYSHHLTEAMPGDVTIFAPANEDVLPGPDSATRLWRLSKLNSRLSRILDAQAARDIDVFVIQFNFGFYNHRDLAQFIRRAKDLGKVVVICLHSTVFPLQVADPDNYHISYLAPALAACDRILVHSIDDLNRLKDLGLVDNVALFPHGVLRRSEVPVERPGSGVPTIATYGFALPHKGLPEMLSALRLLHDRGRPARLRMVNAEYPVPVSAALIEELKKQVRESGLSDSVELHNRFLSDADSMALLSDSDLIVFPYQDTAESASGAVRYGMAVERPVAVTPLPIFSDLEGATFQMPGTSPADLADGIAAALDAIATGEAEAAAIADQAERWRDQHDYRVVARRLFNMCKALASR